MDQKEVQKNEHSLTKNGGPEQIFCIFLLKITHRRKPVKRHSGKCTNIFRPLNFVILITQGRLNQAFPGISPFLVTKNASVFLFRLSFCAPLQISTVKVPTCLIVTNLLFFRPPLRRPLSCLPPADKLCNDRQLKSLYYLILCNKKRHCGKTLPQRPFPMLFGCYRPGSSTSMVAPAGML